MKTPEQIGREVMYDKNASGIGSTVFTAVAKAAMLAVAKEALALAEKADNDCADPSWLVGEFRRMAGEIEAS
jgi:hypothetical protein